MDTNRIIGQLLILDKYRFVDRRIIAEVSRDTLLMLENELLVERRIQDAVESFKITPEKTK